MSLYELFDFSETVIEVTKIAFSLERLYGRKIFWNICRLFFLRQGENTSENNPAKTQSMKSQVKSGKIPVRKNVSKIMQNVGSRRLKTKSAKYTC